MNRIAIIIGFIAMLAAPAFAAEARYSDQRALWEAERRFRKQLAIGLAELDVILAHSEGRNAAMSGRFERISSKADQISAILPDFARELNTARGDVGLSREAVRRWEETYNLPKELLTGLAETASGGFLGMGTAGDVGVGTAATGLTVATILAIMRARRNGSLLQSAQMSGNPLVAAAGMMAAAPFVAPPIQVPVGDRVDDAYQEGPRSRP